MNETMQFLEPFEIYIQALISQCLDSTFLQEVFQVKGKLVRLHYDRIHVINFLFTDEFFVSNIEKVDSVTLLRKDKIITGIIWSRKFQHAIDTWPCLNDLGAAAVQVSSTKLTSFRVIHQLFSSSGCNVWCL